MEIYEIYKCSYNLQIYELDFLNSDLRNQLISLIIIKLLKYFDISNIFVWDSIGFINLVVFTGFSKSEITEQMVW